SIPIASRDRTGRLRRRPAVGDRSSRETGGRDVITHDQLVDDAIAGKAPAAARRNGRADAHVPSDAVFTVELNDSYRMEWLAPAVTIRLEDVRGDRRTGDVKADVDVEAA